MEVKIETLKEGDGTTFPKAGETVTIHYTGTLMDGTKFDSSVDRGEPFSCRIGVGEVIEGWDQAIPKLSVGTKAILTIPSDLAYGASGAGSAIPPNADLRFEVELLGVEEESSWCTVM
jgi:FK506-binding protein 1